MKTRTILLASVALNVLLAAMLLLARGSAPAPPDRAEAPAPRAKSPEIPPATTNFTPSLVPFQWQQVESPDYRVYVANLRAIGCPERLVRDIILADINALYKSRQRDIVRGTFEPWAGADRHAEASRGENERRNALQDEHRALVRDLLGCEWCESGSEAMEEKIVALLLGFLPEGTPMQLVALVEKYGSLGARVRAEADYVLLDADFARLEALHAGLMKEMAALLTPADLDELLARAQIFTTLDSGRSPLEGVDVSGYELREIIRASLIKGDIFRELLQRGSDELPEDEMERREAEFEQKVARILGPVRFADYQLAKDDDYWTAFRFARENRLQKSAARNAGRAMGAAREQLAEIQKDKTLTPDERSAAAAVLAAATRNAVSEALGPAAASYLEENGGFLPGLAPDTKPPGAKP